MFVRYFVEIPRPATEVEEDILLTPSVWASAAATGAESRGVTLLAEVGFGANGSRLAKAVEIEFGPPVRFPSKTVLPMSWRAAGLEGLFPRLEADIEVAPLGPNRTQLSISAQYDPPLGSVGKALDRAVLHRVAEATVKDFLDRTAGTLAGRASVA
jgi:hypothetical protein